MNGSALCSRCPIRPQHTLWHHRLVSELSLFLSFGILPPNLFPSQDPLLLESHCCHCHTCTTHRPTHLPLRPVSPGEQVWLLLLLLLLHPSPSHCFHLHLFPFPHHHFFVFPSLFFLWSRLLNVGLVQHVRDNQDYPHPHALFYPLFMSSFKKLPFFTLVLFSVFFLLCIFSYSKERHHLFLSVLAPSVVPGCALCLRFLGLSAMFGCLRQPRLPQEWSAASGMFSQLLWVQMVVSVWCPASPPVPCRAPFLLWR